MCIRDSNTTWSIIFFGLHQILLALIVLMILIILIIVLISVIGKGLTKVLKMVFLGFVNKVLGGVFGALKFTLMLSLCFVFFEGGGGAAYPRASTTPRPKVGSTELRCPKFGVPLFVRRHLPKSRRWQKPVDGR